MANEARDAPVTPLPVVLYSARNTWSVFGVAVFQTDHMAGLRGAVTIVFLKITLENGEIEIRPLIQGK